VSQGSKAAEYDRILFYQTVLRRKCEVGHRRREVTDRKTAGGADGIAPTRGHDAQSNRCLCNDRTFFALIGMSVRFGPAATRSVTAAGVQPPTGAISPIELMSKNGKALPNQYYRDPF